MTTKPRIPRVIRDTKHTICDACGGPRMLVDDGPGGMWRISSWHYPECPITGDPSLVRHRPRPVDGRSRQ